VRKQLSEMMLTQLGVRSPRKTRRLEANENAEPAVNPGIVEGAAEEDGATNMATHRPMVLNLDTTAIRTLRASEDPLSDPSPRQVPRKSSCLTPIIQG
jgi:hypothetical protein